MRADVHGRAGFTLIEMLIAIGLGAVLCYTAYAGMRVASQCISNVNRLSLNNRMLQSGIAAALEDLDYWDSYDNPDAGDTPLRNMVTGREGAAFAPMDFDGSDIKAMPGTVNDSCFDQSDRKVWYRGDGSSTDAKTTGDFPMLGRLQHPDGIATPLTDSWRVWYHNFIASRINYGYYAYLDYTPANWIHSLYWIDGSVLSEFNSASNYEYHLIGSAANWASQPRGQYELGYGTLFGLTRNPLYTTQLGNVGRHTFCWWEASAGPILPDYSVGDFCSRCGADLQPVPIKPEHWPDLNVVTKHFIVEGRSFHTGTVILRDPVAGANMKLFITNTGTTLRGARRQRGLDNYP